MKQIVFLIIHFLLLSYNNKEVLANGSMNFSITPRIIGGANADMRIHSYTLSIRNNGNFLCTAFAINENEVLSAAHCLQNVRPPYPDVTVHSGTNSPFEVGIVHEIEKITVHPRYTGEWTTALRHDIVHILLKDGSELELNENQLKVDLPKNDVRSGTSGIMTGWGCTTPQEESLSQNLKMLEMRILNYKDCQSHLEKPLSKEHLCAIGSVGHGCAGGDSGGPLVIENTAVGIHSWCKAEGCGAGLAEVFTNLYHEKGFIRKAKRRVPKEDSDSSTESDDLPEFTGGGKKREESSSSKKKGWFRKITCTAK